MLSRLSPLQASCILLAGFFGFYLYALSPSVSVGDSGEFIAAAQTLSLPHAPSYPLFVLLGKCASIVVPWAHGAYRLNLLSMFFGAAACVLIYLLGRSHGFSRIVSFVLAVVFFASGIWREQSAATEVFTLHIFFVVALLLCLSLPPQCLSRERKWIMAFFLLGLGLGNHHTLTLLAPLMIVLMLAERSNDKLFANILPEIPGWILFFTLGFSIYLFLPIRSHQDPPIDWSNPETLHNFIRVITRADYGSFSLSLGEKLPRNFETAMSQVVRYLDAQAGSLGWTILGLGMMGWVVWFFKNRWVSAAYLILFLASGAGFLILGNMPFDSQSTGILPRFYLMSVVPLIIAAGTLLEELKNRIPGVQWLYLALPALVIAGGPRWDHCRNDFFAHDYGRNLLSTLEPGSALFMDGGDDTFYTLAYFHLAQGLRPDLSIHDRGGLIFRNPYGDDFRRIPREMKDERRQQVEGASLLRRPVYYATFNREVLRGSLLYHRGLLTQAVPFTGDFRSSEARERAVRDYETRGKYIWKLYAMRGVYSPLHAPSYRLRALLPIYPFLEGAPSGDLGLFRRAAHFGTDIAWLQSNLAWEASMRAYERSGSRPEEAEKLYGFVLEADPGFVSAYCNLGVLLERRNDSAGAEKLYRQAIAKDPKYAEAYYNLGVLYWKQSRWDEVIALFEKTLQVAPNHPSARNYLNLARLKKQQAGR